MSAGPTSTFHDSAEGDSQYSSGQGNTQFVVSALLTYGWLLKSAGYWQSKIYKSELLEEKAVKRQN
jgi:hypothetical protein